MADAKPQELDPALVERACISQEGGPELWGLMYSSGKVVRRAAMARALLSLGIPAAALNALAKGYAVVVPKEPTDAQEHVGGEVVDRPSVFMGGPSRQGRRTARQAYKAMLTASPYRSEP